MEERLKSAEDAKARIKEDSIIGTVLEIIGGATVIEDGVERQIGPHDIRGVLYHLQEACLATQRLRARQSKQAIRSIKQLCAALRRANQSKGGLPEDIRLVLGLDRMIHHLNDGGQAFVGTINQATHDLVPEKTPDATPAVTDARQSVMETVSEGKRKPVRQRRRHTDD